MGIILGIAGSVVVCFIGAFSYVSWKEFKLGTDDRFGYKNQKR